MASLAERVVGAVKGAIAPSDTHRGRDRLAQLEAELEAARAQASTALRQKSEMFDTVERVCAQRQQWTDMYHEAVASYHRSLQALETVLGRERMTLQRAVLALNALRKEHGLEPVARPEDLPKPEDPPVGTSKLFEQQVQKLDAKAPVPVDGLAERDAIVRAEAVLSPRDGRPQTPPRTQE
jgi:hypothetical protein